MPRRFVDLSIFLENDVLSDPPAFAPKIQYFTHDTTYEQIAPFFPGLKKDDLPDGEGWAVELVQLSTHNGTHLDAPWHFHSTMDKALGDKKPSIAIHDVPLEWCFQPGVKLDFRHFADGYVVTAADVEAELKRIGHTLKPLESVVVNTRAGSRSGPRPRAQCNSQRPAHTPTKLRVARTRTSTQAMVKMKRYQPLSPLRPMRPDEEQQRQRIRAARKRDRPRPACGPRARLRSSLHRRMQSRGRDRLCQRERRLRPVHATPRHG